MIAFKYNQLEALSIEQLKQAYDVVAQNTVVGLSFYREEIARREATRLHEEVKDLTRQMRNMTIAIVILTTANVALVWLALS